jgi:hypothetical protein
MVAAFRPGCSGIGSHVQHSLALYFKMNSKRKYGETVSDLHVAVIHIPTYFLGKIMHTDMLLPLVRSDRSGSSGIGSRIRHSHALPHSHPHAQLPLRGHMSVKLYIVFLRD